MLNNTLTKTLFFLIFLFCGNFYLKAQQCNVSIPFMYVKVSNDQTIDATFAIPPIFWVCEGVKLTITASAGSTFYLEQNASITFVDSDGDAVWAKPGCVVTNNSSESIAVTCNSSTVTLNNTGSGNIVPLACSSVTYNYSLVGGSPCLATPGGIHDYAEIIPVILYPNPVIASFILSMDNTRNFKQLTFII